MGKTNYVDKFQTIKVTLPGKDLWDGLRSRVGGSWEAVLNRCWGAGWGLQPLAKGFLILQIKK